MTVAQSPVETPLARRLAKALIEMPLEAIPDEMLSKTKAHILDQIGVQLCGSTLGGVAPVRAYGEHVAKAGPSLVLGSDQRIEPEYAALINSTMGHGFEMDDYAPRAMTHPGCEVIPAALAIAEELDSTGEEFLRSVALGFEAVVRLGMATMPSMLTDRGFHENCVHGVVSSAIAAGLLKRINPDEMVNAIAIAASHASGTTEYSRSGGEVKRLHSGLGAMGGIRSVRLAQLGFTGPPTIFEGNRGYFQAFCTRVEPEFLCEDWGRVWQFMRYGAIKPHFCVGAVHAHIDALGKIRAAHEFEPTDVEEVILGVDPSTLIHAGAVGPEPRDLVGAQFSAEYCLALAMVRGSNGLESYQEAEAKGFRDPEVLAISRRTRIVEDPEAAKEWPDAYLGRVTLNLRDGRHLSATGYGKGTPSNPMTVDEVRTKYFEVSTRRISHEQAESVAGVVLAIETAPGMRDVSSLLEVDQPAEP